MAALAAGFDEAGKSSVAGPFIVAFIETRARACRLHESKRYTAEQRIGLLPEIGEKTFRWGLGIASACTVARHVGQRDYLGLEVKMIKRLAENLEAPRVYVHRLTARPETTRKLLSWLKPRRLHVVESEESHPAVAMASIAATAARNLIMRELDKALGLGDGELYTDKTWRYIDSHAGTGRVKHVRITYRPVRKRLEAIGVKDLDRLLEPDNYVYLFGGGEHLAATLEIIADVFRWSALASQTGLNPRPM